MDCRSAFSAAASASFAEPFSMRCMQCCRAWTAACCAPDCDEADKKRLRFLAQQCTLACTCTAWTAVCSQLRNKKALLSGGLRRLAQKRRDVDIVHLHSAYSGMQINGALIGAYCSVWLMMMHLSCSRSRSSVTCCQSAAFPIVRDRQFTSEMHELMQSKCRHVCVHLQYASGGSSPSCDTEAAPASGTTCHFGVQQHIVQQQQLAAQHQHPEQRTSSVTSMHDAAEALQVKVVDGSRNIHIPCPAPRLPCL